VTPPDPALPDPSLAGVPDAESLRVEANGIALHAVAAGPRDGPLVLLLHGFPEFWWGWRRQIGPLAAAGLRVVAPDLRGYAGSDKPAEVASYALDVVAADVLGLATRWGGSGSRWSATTGAPSSPGTWRSGTRRGWTARRS
jgi:pimeloyl-ACP methyl ester carboxylesterase